ncbi:hypothetical protein GCM10009592_32330 [Brachybacterium rhamnosum]|uniref:Polymerase nucleotidyl transferase domain-containing protein n=1 Tax=Brachybacterium rhamnosum TaxID=173361 RepID=A0ABW4Q4H4_9MICO|nr:hypothetical protein [Brachybacterium sp. SGAir0954]
MTSWQPDLLARLAERVPGDVVPYGSVTAPELLDGWSDLDVAVTAREPFAAHHRTATEHDSRAAEAQAVLAGPLGARTALDAYTLYGRPRAEIEPVYAADPAPLEAVLRRGAASGSRR